jgi:hypothetical protein
MRVGFGTRADVSNCIGIAVEACGLGGRAVPIFAAQATDLFLLLVLLAIVFCTGETGTLGIKVAR